MEFDFPQINRPLKFFLKVVEIEKAINRLVDCRLRKHSHQAVMINEVECNLLEQNKIWHGRDVNDR